MPVKKYIPCRKSLVDKQFTKEEIEHLEIFARRKGIGNIDFIAGYIDESKETQKDYIIPVDFPHGCFVLRYKIGDVLFVDPELPLIF